jgi:hypothetical protein
MIQRAENFAGAIGRENIFSLLEALRDGTRFMRDTSPDGGNPTVIGSSA